MKVRRVAGPSKAAQAREQRLEEVRACACRTLAASNVTEPNLIDIDHIAAAFGAMSRRLLNLGGGRARDHYAAFARGATAVVEFS